MIMPISTYNWFSGMNNCTTIDIINLNTKNNKNMNGMFSNCSKLTKIKGLTKLNTSNVTNKRIRFARLGYEKCRRYELYVFKL